MKTRVLRVITRMNIGGPALHVGVLTTGLSAARFETLLALGRSSAVEGDVVDQVLTPQVRMMRLRWMQRALHPLKDVVTWWQLARLIRRFRPHIVHTHMAKAGALGRSAAWCVSRFMKPADRPVVMHTFHGHVLDGYFSRSAERVFTAIERWLARRTHQLIAVSDAVKDDLVARGIATATRIRVIPLGLPLELLERANGPRYVWRSAGDHATLLVVWAGRLVPIKRAELLLEGLRLLRQRAPQLNVRSIVAGDGELRGRIERAITEHRLADRVHCAGWVRDMPSLYADADVVCLTSANEGTPVSLIEALAAGKPVVATAVGGVPDVLGVDRATAAALQPGSFLRGAGGLLVRSGDVEGFAAALAACAADAALRRALGEEGKARVRERYAASRLIRDIEALYLEWMDRQSCTVSPAHEAAACAS